MHCSARGHPIVGDLTYGQALGQEDQPFRMMLHAFYLRIPTSAECVESLPSDPLRALLDACSEPSYPAAATGRAASRSCEPPQTLTPQKEARALQPLHAPTWARRPSPPRDRGAAGLLPAMAVGVDSWSQTTESIMLGGEQQAGTLQGGLLVRALDSPCCGQA